MGHLCSMWTLNIHLPSLLSFSKSLRDQKIGEGVSTGDFEQTEVEETPSPRRKRVLITTKSSLEVYLKCKRPRSEDNGRIPVIRMSLSRAKLKYMTFQWRCRWKKYTCASMFVYFLYVTATYQLCRNLNVLVLIQLCNWNGKVLSSQFPCFLYKNSLFVVFSAIQSH